MDIALARILLPVIGDYLGQTLTPEVATKIAGRVMAACYPGAVDVSQIAPRTVGSYELSCVRLADVHEHLKVMHMRHWMETEGYRHGLEFNPDYDRAIDLEMQGRYLLIVATHKASGQFVANYSLYLSRSMHTQTLMATEDTLFVAKEHRRGRLGVSIIKYGEQVLADLGVQELNVSVKHTNNVGPMIERMGYQPVATQYTKILKE